MIDERRGASRRRDCNMDYNSLLYLHLQERGCRPATLSSKIVLMRLQFLFVVLFLALTFSACDSGGSEPANVPPDVDFGYTPQNPEVGTAVSFTANASDSDGQIQSYSWDFDGDGTQDASGANPTYTYTSSGSYSVDLTVTDDDGATGRDVQGISVEALPENQPPRADFSYTPENPRAGTGVDFTANATDSDGQIQSYSWDFNGDGQQDASGTNPTYAYDNSGTYTASLTVTDDDGDSDVATQTVSVRQQFTQVSVTDIDLIEMPFTVDGQGWDPFSGPDVYVRVTDSNDDIVAESGFYSDISESDLPLDYSGAAFTITDLSEPHSISIYDSDTNADDFIGGIVYTYENSVGEYPTTLTLDAGGGIVYDLTLEWSN